MRYPRKTCSQMISRAAVAILPVVYGDSPLKCRYLGSEPIDSTSVGFQCVSWVMMHCSALDWFVADFQANSNMVLFTFSFAPVQVSQGFLDALAIPSSNWESMTGTTFWWLHLCHRQTPVKAQEVMLVLHSSCSCFHMWCNIGFILVHGRINLVCRWFPASLLYSQF